MKIQKKKLKKIRERTDVHRCTGIRGGWVYPAHANTRNGVNGDIQRFATLVCFVVDDFKRGKQGKEGHRHHHKEEKQSDSISYDIK